MKGLLGLGLGDGWDESKKGGKRMKKGVRFEKGSQPGTAEKQLVGSIKIYSEWKPVYLVHLPCFMDQGSFLIALFAVVGRGVWKILSDMALV